MFQRLWKVQRAGPIRNKNYPLTPRSKRRDTQIDVKIQSTVESVVMEAIQNVLQEHIRELTRTSQV